MSKLPPPNLNRQVENIISEALAHHEGKPQAAFCVEADQTTLEPDVEAMQEEHDGNT